MVKSYPRPVEESLIDFLAEFVREAIFELKEELLFFLIIDNASLMDSASWNLFEAVTGTCEHLVIIMCL